MSKPKVIAINGSARTHGNTAILLETISRILKSDGIEVVTHNLSETQLQTCRACFACSNHGRCILNDPLNDMVEDIIDSDGLILGSPVYSADVSSLMKTFMERAGVIAAVNPGIFRHKAGAAVAAVRRGGGMTTIDSMNRFFLNKEMIVIGSTYWNMVHGKDPSDVLADGEGMANIENLAHNISWFIKTTRMSGKR